MMWSAHALRCVVAAALAQPALVQPALAQSAASLAEVPAARIDVIVSDGRGRVVEGLTAADFELAVNGTPLAIEAVQLVTAHGRLDGGETLEPIETRADEQAQAAREGTRLFGILLDEYHVTAGRNTETVRSALRQFVEEHLGPRDLVVLVKPLDSLTNLRVTRDRDAMLRAISRFEGRKGDYTPRDTFERNFFAGSPARVEAMRAQVTVSALNALAVHLGGLNAARKSIIVVSEGLTAPQRRRGEAPLPTVETVIRSANRGNVSVYPFEPSGTAQGPEREVLQVVAAETDGVGPYSPAAFAEGFSRVAQDTSAFYLLTVRSTADGGFHPLSVRVKHPGAVVRARKGFWAPSIEESRVRSASTAPRSALPPALPRRASPLIRPWFGQARADGGRTRVSFVWEPAARVPGQAARQAPSPARITFRALAADGTTLFEGVARPAGHSVGASGVEPARLEFEAPPGRVRIEMSIEDVQQRPLDTDVREVNVGDFSGPLVLGTAEVLRARTAREFRALESDPAAAPTPAREFSRAERLLIRVPAYTVEQEPRPDPVVRARLLSRLGSAMRDLSVTPGPLPDFHQIDLPLAGLATGEYIVELTATLGERTSKDTVAFRVTP